MPPARYPLTVTAGDDHRWELRDIRDEDDQLVDLTEATLLAQIRATAAPGTTLTAALDVEAPEPGLLVLELHAAESEKLRTLQFEVDGQDNSARATARWDLEVLVDDKRTTILAGLVTVHGDVSREVAP